MAQLLAGPPGSGKTYEVLAALEQALRRGEPALLIVPTASMAEHLAHQLARRGMAMSPNAVRSMGAFVEQLTPACRQPPPATERLILEQALETLRPPEFAAVAAYPGFQARLLDTMREFWSAGAGGRRLAALATEPRHAALARVMREQEKVLQRGGLVHRDQRLGMAAEQAARQRFGALFFDGFLNFTATELALLGALAGSAARLLVTLPEGGAEPARQALLEMGFEQTSLGQARRKQPAPVLVRAASPEREIEDVARRIQDRQECLSYRDHGIVLRNPDLYLPIIAVVFDRCGIPFRSWEPRPLQEHAAIRYLTGLLDAALGGFEAGPTLEVLKLAGSGLATDPEMDRFEFLIREDSPERGLEALQPQAEGFAGVRQAVARLAELGQWTRQTQSPDRWAARMEQLANRWLRLPRIEDGVSHSQALEWRALARAVEAWGQAAEEAAGVLGLRGLRSAGLAAYLAVLKAVLRLTRFRAPDRRRDVVQVMNVWEARQWELPVVFVCGLVEKQFPQHPAQNLFFSDGQRRMLGLAGLRLRTTEEWSAEEHFLFEMALSRATQQLYLSWPDREEGGGETLPSFFLEPLGSQAAEAGRPVFPEQPMPWRPPAARLEARELLPALVARHDRFSPTALEQYLQCPFQFFAARTLKLAETPRAPEERIDALLMGTIIHRVIARWAARGGPEVAPVFEEVFREVCAQESLRLNFRAEALKTQLLADLERFAAQERRQGLPTGFQPGRPESAFEYVVDAGVDPPFRIAGRIDRYEVSGAGAAVVIDYKYSRSLRLERLVRESEAGLRVQAPLYLLGIEKQYGLAPAGMLFYGLRREVSRKGWLLDSLATAEDSGIERRTAAGLRAMLEAAAARTIQVVGEIRDGRVEAAPRDFVVCRDFCPYRPVCRINL